MSDQRRTERKNGDTWEPIDFSDLRAGDIFRLFESTGEPVVDPMDDSAEFLSLCDAYEVEEPVYKAGHEEPVDYIKTWTVKVRGLNNL
jgi:hypothetical protein